MRSFCRMLVIGALLLLSACGEAGPVGPPGPPGNANVQTVTIDFIMDDALVDGRFASVRYDVPALTVSVVDAGAVLAFFREAQTWTAMPYTYGIESGSVEAVDHTITLGYAYEFDDQGGFVDIFYEASTDAIDLRSLPDQVVKLVMIDGFAVAKSGVDLADYEAVMDYFNIDG